LKLSILKNKIDAKKQAIQARKTAIKAIKAAKKVPAAQRAAAVKAAVELKKKANSLAAAAKSAGTKNDPKVKDFLSKVKQTRQILREHKNKLRAARGKKPRDAHKKRGQLSANGNTPLSEEESLRILSDLHKRLNSLDLRVAKAHQDTASKFSQH